MILCSILYRYVDTRPISAMGVLLVAFGFLLCCLVYHVTVVTIVLGVVVGLGQGMMYFSNAIIINQYFLKNRVSGNGEWNRRNVDLLFLFAYQHAIGYRLFAYYIWSWQKRFLYYKKNLIPGRVNWMSYFYCGLACLKITHHNLLYGGRHFVLRRRNSFCFCPWLFTPDIQVSTLLAERWVRSLFRLFFSGLSTGAVCAIPS